MKTNYLALLSATALLSLTAFAEAAEHVIIAPQCLLTSTHVTANVLATHQSLVLARVSDEAIEQLSNGKHASKKPCGGFRDITHRTDYVEYFNKETNKPLVKKAAGSYQIRYEKEVNQLITTINPDTMWNSLITFSSKRDRHANTDLGVAAANWIKTQVETMAAGRSDVSVYTIATKGYKQPSVVVKIGTSNDAGVIVGAHMDTVSSIYSIKPGADDDGSGSMTTLEALRNLLASNMKFKKPVYFIWYAAEEEGLVGSQQVVAEFQKKKIPVAAVMHFDLTGYAYKNEKTMWVIDDYVDNDLSAFLATLIKTYAKRPVEHTRCGYACSDHASWTVAGYPAVIPAESRYEDTNPSIHSSNDTIDKLSKEHMTDYAKVASAFVVELAEPLS